MTINPVGVVPYVLLIAGGVWLGTAIHVPALGVVVAFAACVGWAYARQLTREPDRAEPEQSYQHCCGAGQLDSPDS